MMEMVANASPLIFLAKIDHLVLLEDYCIFVPSQVIAEIEEGKDKPEKAQILCFLKSENVRLQEAKVMGALPESLGIGERSAISLAVERKIPSILLDERKARRIARFYGLDPRGTLWVLKEAQRKRTLRREEVEERQAWTRCTIIRAPRRSGSACTRNPLSGFFITISITAWMRTWRCGRGV